MNLNKKNVTCFKSCHGASLETKSNLPLIFFLEILDSWIFSFPPPHIFLFHLIFFSIASFSFPPPYILFSTSYFFRIMSSSPLRIFFHRLTFSFLLTFSTSLASTGTTSTLQIGTFDFGLAIFKTDKKNKFININGYFTLTLVVKMNIKELLLKYSVSVKL